MSQPSLWCLSLHEVDFLLPVAKKTLNDTPQSEDDKGRCQPSVSAPDHSSFSLIV